MKDKIIIGTRGSRLALWQAEYVSGLLRNAFPLLKTETKIIETTGDARLEIALSKIGDKGLFTRQIEEKLLAGEIDLAVHSLKDLQTVQPEGLKIGAVTKRETPNDALLAKTVSTIEDLPANARVATGSLRRRSQLLNLRPDLQIFEIRGNVPTRVEKFQASDLDAIILAFAGLHRLEMDAHVKQIISVEQMIPAVAQGVVGVEIRSDDFETAEIVRSINDGETEKCVRAERSFLRTLEGGCQVPIGGFAVLENDKLFLRGFVGDADGETAMRDSIRGDTADGERLGEELARRMIENGANRILEATRETTEKTREAVI